MTTTITIEDDLLADLKLIKRVNVDLHNMTQVIRDLLTKAGYTEERLEYMHKFLKEWSE